MKIRFHDEMVEGQQYGCICCGAGCRSFLIPVRDEERRAIEGLADWRKELGVDDLWATHRGAGASGWALRKREDGACIFLGADNLCEIHRRFGLEAKPLACQLFPFVLTPFAGELRVGLRFDCRAVCRNQGKMLTEHRQELNKLASKLVPVGTEAMPIPDLIRGVTLPAEWLDHINETLVEIMASNAMTLLDRLYWMRALVSNLGRIKWQDLEDEEFYELIAMLRKTMLVESQHRTRERRAVTGKTRKLFAEYLFILSQPTSLVGLAKTGVLSRWRMQWGYLRQMLALGRTVGALPRVREDWPRCDLADLEESFGEWPKEVQELVGRYLLCRLAGMNTMGPNFYGYSLEEGANSLLIVAAVLGWLMRLEAIKEGRSELRLADAERAVMTIDGNLGYGQALGQGMARWRLRYLSGEVEALLGWYCE